MGAAKKKKSIPEVKREKLRLDEIEFDPEAKALASSDQMRPYIQFMAAIYSKDEKAWQIASKKIKALPLGKRYIWRIVEALKWGFSDFNSSTLRLDLECLSDADRQKIDKESLYLQLVRLCLFLQVLFGRESMKKLIESAVEKALAYGMSSEIDEKGEVN